MLNEKEVEVEKEFEDFVRNKLTDEQFWAWTREWLEVEVVIETALGWSTELKKDELDNLRKIIKNNE